MDRIDSVLRTVAFIVLAGCGAGREPLEVIARVPEHVLTASEVRSRMRRLGGELGVGTDELLVEGQCVSVCSERSSDICVLRLGDPADRPIPVLLSDDSELEKGKRYVLRGSVRADERIKERWVFVGSVMAEVQSAP